jgi:tRNA pseudouridine55 synthase
MNTTQQRRANELDEACGILVIDKPAGWTSHDVVGRVRRLLRMKRVGHTGTLDPAATGVLVCLVGRATRLAQFLNNSEKQYDATIRFGYATDTGDAEGARIKTAQGSESIVASVSGDATLSDDATLDTDVTPCDFDAAQLEAAMDGLRGWQEQIPPMYSAKKIAGRKLYELARRGEEIERQPVRIHVREFVALPREDGSLFDDKADGTRELSVRVACSAGTYIRTLAETLGTRLGTSAHLALLRRTRAGAFTLADRSDARRTANPRRKRRRRPHTAQNTFARREPPRYALCASHRR